MQRIFESHRISRHEMPTAIPIGSIMPKVFASLAICNKGLTRSGRSATRIVHMSPTGYVHHVTVRLGMMLTLRHFVRGRETLKPGGEKSYENSYSRPTAVSVRVPSVRKPIKRFSRLSMLNGTAASIEKRSVVTRMPIFGGEVGRRRVIPCSAGIAMQVADLRAYARTWKAE